MHYKEMALIAEHHCQSLMITIVIACDGNFGIELADCFLKYFENYFALMFTEMFFESTDKSHVIIPSIH